MSYLLKAALILFLSICTISFKSQAETISALKAAELACHRIERLVTQKKIEKNFVSKFQKLTIVALNNDPIGGAFAATVYQNAPTIPDGLPISITILFDSAGMVLKYSINEGGTQGADIVWTGKDPIALTEAGLHYVLDNQRTSEELKPFADHFQSLILEQKIIDGVVTVELKLSNNINNSKLVLIMDINGKLLNKNVIP